MFFLTVCKLQAVKPVLNRKIWTNVRRNLQTIRQEYGGGKEEKKKEERKKKKKKEGEIKRPRGR